MTVSKITDPTTELGIVDKINEVIDNLGGGGGAVDSVNGQTGVVVLTASDVGALPSSTVIPTVNNSTITITQGGVTKGSFTLNQSSGATIALDAGGGSTYHPTLFTFQWSDCLKNDIQWLRADTFSWQSGAVYETAYNHLVDDIDGKTAQTETVGSYTITFYEADDGHKVVLADQETTVQSIYAESGVAWYYILDTINQRFKLPRKLPFDGQAKGNGMTLGLTDGTNNLGIGSSTAGVVYINNANFNKTPSTTPAGTTCNYGMYGVNTDPTKSGIILNRDNTGSQKYLYFYVGSFTQTAIENTAGLNAELFNGKLDLDMGNVASSTKETIIGWGMPDYSAGVSKSWNTSVQADKDGWVYVKGGGNTSDASYVLEISTDGSTWTRVASMYAYSSNTTGAVLIPMPKGIYYKASQSPGARELIFYPCKGA